MAHPRAGQLAQPEDLIDLAELVTAYYTKHPDLENIDQQVDFGTSGHPGHRWTQPLTRITFSRRRRPSSITDKRKA